MASEALHDSTELQVPDDDLGVLPGAGNESIAFTDIDVGDEIEVPVQARLKPQSVSIPHLDDPTDTDSDEQRNQDKRVF